MKDLLTIHKEILAILETQRKKNPTLYFKPRQQNNSNRLSNGYYFIGNKKYLMVGLSEGGDKKEKIHNIGFTVIENGKCALEFSSQDDEVKAHFLSKLAKRLSMHKKPNKKARWIKEYKTSYDKALIECIQKDIPIINEAISSEENKTNISLITEKKFNEYIENLSKFTAIQDKVARLCWNKNGWQFPSGPEGKSKHKDSYEYEEGFGHEEWLFNPTMAIDGYCYAYLQPINTTNRIHENAIYNIEFYTKAPNGEYCYVKKINNVECITRKKSEEILKIYKKKGWYKEMKNHVKQINGNARKVNDPELGYFVNIRFKPGNVIPIQEKLLIDSDDLNIRSKHYKLINKISDFKFKAIEEESISGSCNLKSTEERKRFVCHTSEFDPVHDNMQNHIAKLLKESDMYKAETVYTEHERVDIKAQAITGEWHFFELKTDSAKLSIRKALGQLLEYAHYPNEKKASKMYIVSHEKIETEDSIYLEHLRNLYHIPIWYRQYSFKTNTLEPEE